MPSVNTQNGVFSQPGTIGDDWEITDASDEGGSVRKEALEAQLGLFDSRKVTDIKKDQLPRLQRFQGECPESSEYFGYQLLRLIGRFISTFLPSQPVYIKPVSIGNTVSEKQVRPETADVYVSDKQLSEHLGYENEYYVRDDPDAVLFHKSNPVPEDIRQTDARSTCYLLSALASYAASPVGKKSLLAHMQPTGTGSTVVTFHDPAISKNIKIMVDDSRLVDEEGHDIYSFENSSGARWPGTFEKAFHAFRSSRVERLETLRQEAMERGREDELIHINALMQEVVHTEAADNLIDHANLFNVLRFLPPLPERSSPDPHYRQVSEVMGISEDELKEEESLEQLKFNVEQGVPVILGTRSDLWGAVNAISTGTPTGHSVAVLAPARTVVDGEQVEGVLIYDPYGESLDGEEEVDGFTDALGGFDQGERLADHVLLTKASGRSVRFCAYRDLYDNFCKGAVAPGGYRRV